MKKLRLFLKKIYARHTVGKIFLTVAAAALLIYVIVSIPVWMIGQNDIARSSSRASENAGGGALDKTEGKVTLAENGGKVLSINTETLVLEVVDTATGEIFTSAVAGAESGSELALLSLRYLGEDNNLYEWNSYDNCTLFGSYELYPIENGVKIEMNLNEGESGRFYEYLPKKMPIERYEEMFKKGLEELRDSGELDSTRATRLLGTLSLVYRRSLTEECYAVTYTGTPPTSAVNQMIEAAGLVGYTREMLLEDSEAMGYTISFTEPALFDLVLEIKLENGELVAHLPSGECISGNDFYTIQNVRLLPNFGAVTSEQYAEGQILVPDGSGALFAFNSYRADVREYERPMYNNDYYSDYWYMPDYGEELYMPVYGMIYGSSGSTEKGFLAIVEEGSRNAYMHVKLAGSGADSSKYNKAYASFELSQYSRVKINGAYSNESANYLVNTGAQDIDCTLRFRLFGSGVDYFTMAKSYQAYLADSLGIGTVYDNGEAQLYIEAVGALNLYERFVGIPYRNEISMTDYEELLEIMKSLGDTNYMLQYDGVFNDGWNGTLENGAKLSGSNGSKKEFEELLEYAESQNIQLFLETTLSRIYGSGNGFRASTHAVRNYANDEVEISRYMAVLGILSSALNDGISHDTYYTLSPRYLGSITDSFLEDAADYAAFAVTDLAGMYYADYRFNGFVSGEEGNMVLNESLEKLSEGRKLALTNPHIDKIGFGSVAADVSRESSDYSTFEYTIPFKQLVMNGLIEYTTENVNLSSRNAAYFVLQAAETGALPKFILTSKNVDVLKNSDYSYLYSAQFEILADTINEVYAECSEIRSQIGTSEITGHEILDEGVYRTTYATGVVVTVNYNLYAVTLMDGSVLEAESYMIGGGE